MKHEVRVGNVYADKDKREAGRCVRVQDIGPRKVGGPRVAHCWPCRLDGEEYESGRRTYLSFDRLANERGWRLVKQAEESAGGPHAR